MSKLFKVILTIILFLISLNYTNEIIIYFQKKDPLMKEIINKQDDYYIKPLDAVITKNFVIKEVNGRKVNIKKSYKKMKPLGVFNESLLVYENVLPNISYLNKYDKVIISRGNSISLVFEINDKNLFYSINKILVDNNIEASILLNNIDNDLNIKDCNFKNTISTTYHKQIDYCISFNTLIDTDCEINKKYTLLIKENIMSSNFLNNTKKAIDNHSNMIIYRFKQTNLTNLNTIIKYLKSNYIDLTSIDYFF